jgi:hypothetical protein
VSGQWIYRVIVPDEKSDVFIDVLARVDLIDEENLTVVHAPDGSGEGDE